MPKFHPLKIRDIRRETGDCVSIGFEVPAELKNEYAFSPGQHLTLRTRLNGEEIRRSYSICTSPADDDLRVAVKKVEGGRFSTFANEKLQQGQVLDVMSPMGTFTPKLSPEQAKYYVAFAAGSGITPVISIMKSVMETEPQSCFTLFYTNQRTDSIIFLERLDALKSKYMERLAVHYILTKEDPGTELLHGRIDRQKCQRLCSALLDVEDVDEFFLCGPEEMIRNIKATLTDLGVDGEKVHFELFTASATKKGSKKVKWIPPAQPVLSKITITLDGKTFAFDYNSSGQVILDAAQKAGADLPYACKGGVCCTCKAKVLEGDVEMEVNYGLVPEQVAVGYVLTCQAHPRTEKVVLSFDE
ncbi:MAG: 1,2-phenylacetyl-CoA epoxidase subunit PaaE [Saprospiraceae bacterium]